MSTAHPTSVFPEGDFLPSQEVPTHHCDLATSFHLFLTSTGSLPSSIPELPPRFEVKAPADTILPCSLTAPAVVLSSLRMCPSMAAPDLFLLQHPCPVDPGPHIRRQHYLLIQSSILRTLLGHSFVQLLDAAKGGRHRVRAGLGSLGIPRTSTVRPGSLTPSQSPQPVGA